MCDQKDKENRQLLQFIKLSDAYKCTHLKMYVAP